MKKRLLPGTEIYQDIIGLSKDPELVSKALTFLDSGEFLHKSTYDTVHKRMFTNSLLPSAPGHAWDRFFEGAGRIMNGERMPLWVDIAVTGRCHCDCWHCFRASYADRGDLSPDVVSRIVRDAFDLGAVMIGITGGEPMMHGDIIEILGQVPEGMEVQLYSTGHLVDEGFIEQAEKTRLTRCIISLDHYDAAIVNDRRNRSHAFDEAVHALGLLAQSSIFTAASLCMTEDLCTRDAISRYLDLAIRLNVDEIRFILPIPQGRLAGRDPRRLYVKAGKIMRQLREQTAGDESVPSIMLFPEIESRACFGCGAGFHYVAVNNDGQVTPCVAVPLGFGDINTTGFKEIYGEMGSYFTSPGTTCLGRRLDRVIAREGFSSAIYPYTLDDSRRLASLCRVRENKPDFFKHLIHH